MSFRSFFLSAAGSLALATSVFAADGITIEDPYARSAGKNAKAGAAFMMIVNQSGADDRLVGVKSDVSDRTELHTHRENADGVMQMRHVEEGFAIPAGQAHILKRGGDHVMFMGIQQPFEQGAIVPVTLIFEKAGEIEVEIPVDLERKPKHGGHGSGG